MANWKYSGKPPVIKQPPLPPQFPFKVDWSRLFGGFTKPTIGLSNTLTFLPPKRFDTEGFSDPEFEAQRIQQNFINRQYYIPPPPGRPFEQDPKDIEKGMIPVVRKWRPDYDPTFWENPRHVAKAYLQYKSAKPGDIIPEWYDPEAFEQAYRYLEARNKGAPWYEWKYLHPDDPGRQFLQQLPMPSMDYALPKEEYQQWLTTKLLQENPESWDPNELLKLPEEVRNALLQQRQAARMITPYEELPTWQKINLRLMSSPMAQGAATMLPFAVLGGIAGAAAGLPGVALGAAAPLAVGAGLGYIAQKSPTAANLLMILDYPAEWLEQALGVGLQVAGSAINPQFYGSLEEVLNNLPAAWQAARLTATTGAYLSYGPEAPLNFLYPALGLDPNTRGRFDLTNVMPAINYAIAYLAGNEEELKKIYFAGPNQVFLPNVAVPQTVEATGLAALVNMRREIINGADPVDVLNRYTEQFGLSGQFTELASHIVLDPLNLIPGSATKIIGRVGGLLGDVHLAHAFESSIGPIQGFKKYRNAIRTGLVAPADELTAFQRFVAGLNEEGMIKSLMPEPAPTNPIKRAFSYMVNLTPESKARLFVSHIADNIGVLLDMRRSDPDGQVALLRAVANRPPHESAEIAKFLGNPELYTGQQALKMAVPTAEALLELYHSADTPRALLRKLVKIMADPEEAKAIQNHYERLYANMPKDMREALISRATERAIEARTGSSILQQMKKMDDAETFFQHLNSRLDRLAPDLAQELRADPSFNAEGIKTMMEAFAGEKPIPWHPDEFSAHLYGAVNETTAKWAVSAYGVSPNSSFFRFFDLLKRAQSILLLGFNPNYVVGNELGNIIGRASTGVWGYSSLRTINDYMSRIGVEPYRFEAGVGAAGIVPESKLRQTEKTAVGEPIGRVSETGEEIIRKATVEASGLISKIRNKVDAASRFGVFSQASREIERLESMQAWYRGLRKTINWMWHRDNMIPKMPPEVVDWLRMNNIDPNTIYAAVEGSLNADELNVRLEGEPIRYDIDEALARVANEQGISLPMARDTLDEAYLVLQKALKDAKTPDEVRAAFAAAEDTVQKHIDTLLRENLHTRAEQVTQQVASSGFVEALRLWEEMHFTIEEYWIRHFDEWEHTFELVESLKSQGAGRDIVDRVFRARMKDAKRQWKRVRDFEKTTTKAILEGLGVDDANVRRYVDALERVGEKWDEFYSAKEKAISDVVQKVKREEFKTDAERIEAWNKVEEEFNTRYQKTAEEVARDYQEVDELFITMATEQFGENVGSTARWWRERIQQLRQDGNKLIAEFRASLVGSDGPTRRIAWEQFLNETYRPFIYRFFEELDAGAIEVYRSAMGNPPPEGAPPANPKPLPPEPTRPLPGEPSLDPEADAALSRFESYIRELTDDDGLRQQAVEDFRNRIEEAIETGELRIEIEGDAPTPDELARWRAFRDLARSMGYELSEPEIAGGAPAKAPRPEVPVEIKRPEVAPEEMPKPYEGLQPGTPDWIRVWREYPELQDEMMAYRRRLQQEMPATETPPAEPMIQPTHRIVGELVGKISQAVQPEAPRPAKTDLDAINALARQYKIATATERGIPTRTMLNIVNKFLRGEYGEPKNVRGEVYEPVVYRDIQDVDLELIQDALDARQRFKEFSQGSGNAVGPYPPGALESFGTPEYAGITEAAAWEQRARPLLEGIEHELLTRGTSQRNIGGMDMPPHVRSAYKRWRADVERNLSSTKLAAIRWAENLRDQALINYSKQRGIDNFLNILFPYQFWYTRSMWQWAQRMIDRPKWFANYARLRNYQRNLIAIPGFPSRLRDKMAIPAPYLPDWAGDEVWIDPLRNVFYPEQFMSPIDRLAQQQSEQEQRATYVIQRWVSEGKLGKEQAKQALMSRSGPTWELAMADAARSIQAEEGNNLDFMNLVLGPALYLTLPAYLATGKDIITGRDDIPLLPITRTGRSLKAITKNTPLHALGQAIGGIMAWPEEALRRKRGLSEFGDWGNYYVDRMLSNMAAEGKYSPREIVQAMIERDGNPLYEEAVERVRLETALRTSGALPAYALLHGAAWNNPAEFVAASLFGWLPAHLFPEGELEQRKLGELYKLAREQYNAGDPEALNRFFDEHPEYEARLALYAEPEERLRQFLISEVWERYTNLPSVDKQAVREAFGELFTRYFLDNDTRNYDALDNDTLAAWARYMGSTINIGAEGSEDVDIGRLMQAPPKEAAAVEAYRQLRNQLFPNWYAVQSMYYEYPKGSPGRQQVLERFPWLKEYWEWNREYKKANPVIAKYTSEPQDRTVVPYDLSFVKEFSPALARTLLGHYSRGEPLSSGALSELRYIWNKYGRPGDDFETFLENVLPLAISP